MPRDSLILLLRGPWGSRRYASDGRDITIGRGKVSTVRIPDDKASRLHCRIKRAPGGFRVQDLESSNGTFLNGQCVTEAPIRPGDRLEVGRTTVELLVEAADRPEADPAEPEEEGPGSDREVRRWGRQIDHLNRQVENLKTLLEINRQLASELDKDRLWARIIDTAIQLTRAERGFLILIRDDRMVFEVARSFRREEVGRPEYEVSRSIALEVARDNRPLITANAEEDDRFESVHSVAKLKLRSILCVPLRQGGDPIGALYLDNRFEEGLFTEDDAFLLESFAAQATLALNNADLFAALEGARDEVAALNRTLQGKVETQQEELDRVRRALETQQQALGLRGRFPEIVGRSESMSRVLRVVDRITPTALPVLVVGESGTGKELVARAIHFNSPRASGPFVSENCAAIPATLFESELFGHCRGAFTGANADRRGLIEQADGGTLFLDEIGDLDIGLQNKLMRVLQEGEIRRLGDKSVRKVDVRFVTATNRDLSAMMRERKFREDLYYRICGVAVALPPLRERVEDIPPLVKHFQGRIAAEEKRPIKSISAEALRALAAHTWPGNVRELENELRRAWHLAGEEIGLADLSATVRQHGTAGGVSAGTPESLRRIVDRVERAVIQEALNRFRGNKSRVARVLGVSRVGLRKKMVRLGLLGVPDDRGVET